MTLFRIEKVIAQLPSTLHPSTLYVIRVGEGYKLKVTDQTGSIAYDIDADTLDGFHASDFDVWTTQAINTDTTLEPNHFYLVDTSNGPLTLTLPASPSDKTQIKILDVTGNFKINPIIVARNGSTIMGLAEDMTVCTPNVSFGLLYYSGDWRIV